MTREELADPTEDDASLPDSPPPAPRRRFLPLLLVAGFVATLVPLAPYVPHEHQIDFRIEDDVASVQRFDVSWVRLDGEVRGEAVAGKSLRFDRGQAPKIVSVYVRLPNGSYALDITLERADRTDSIQRRVTLGDADRITVPLQLDRPRP